MSRRSPVRPMKSRVEAVEVARQHLLGVAGGVGGHVDDVDLRPVGRAEPGHRRGQVAHHDAADVGAVGVAEEDQRERLVGVPVSEYGAPAVSVSGGAEHLERRVEPLAGELGRPLRRPSAPPQPARSTSGDQQGERRGCGALLATPDPGGEVLGEGRQRAQPGRAVVGVVEQRAHERGAHDHAVGVRRHLGGLVAGADAEPDADRQVRVVRARVRATSGPARSLVVVRAPVTPMTAVA